MKEQKFAGAMLPQTAELVKVTNVLTPYIIRIHKVKQYDEKLDFINKMLLKRRSLFKRLDKNIEPKIGDAVVVCNNTFNTPVDMPGWLCRGYISCINHLEVNYNIFLCDYGISIVSQRENFVIYSSAEIYQEEKHLSFTVGLYNVLPADVKDDLSENKETLVILKEWSTSAIEYTRNLLKSSDMIYFDHLASDPHGRYYGEFYLSIDDNVIRLSEALVLNQYAVYLQGELLQFIKDPTSPEKLDTKMTIHDETTYCLKVSNTLDNDSKRQEENQSYPKINKSEREKYLHSLVERDKEKVLIYGDDKIVGLSSILDAKFPAEVHKAWKDFLKSLKPRKIQSYMWPVMKKNFDLIAVGAPQSGKTTGHAFAICGLLATNPKISQGINPSTLILCSSSSDAMVVSSLCEEFLQNYKTIRSIAAINGKPERSLVAEMYNGCQILVSTPKFLTRFMNRNKKLLHFRNLRYLILDDGDIILDKYFNSISQLFKKHNVIQNRELKDKTLQIVITATHWTAQLRRMASILMDNPCICIASFIEASIFKSVRPRMCVVNSKQKDKKLLKDILNNEYLTSRTMIVCRNSSEAEKLQECLKEHEKEILLATENMNFDCLRGIRQYWNACTIRSYPILICTDDILSDISVTNVAHLIHYSVPLSSKTQFNFRFSTLLDNLRMQNHNCKVFIIMDENNDVQLLHIIKIMQRMNVIIPENISENIRFITAALEKKKENYSICNNTKSWGFCHKPTSCIFRHKVLAKVDNPVTNIRIKDKVKFRVVSIHDATHFSARIISYIKYDTLEEIEFSNTEYMEITVKMQEFYSSAENRKKCETIKVGSLCSLEESVDTFIRVQILHIEREDKTENPKQVDVRCIDNGVILSKVNVYRLLHLSEELANYPMQVVEVFLVGVVPPDDEYVWNNCTINAVYEWFKENVSNKSYMIGTVNLHLENTIWVDTLEVGTKLMGYRDLIGSSLKTELLTKEYAVENEKHLEQMYQLCKDAGYSNINGFDLDT